MKTNLLIKLNNVLILVFTLFLFSCGVGPKSNSNTQLNGVSEGFYTSFFKEEGKTVYFIKPIDFEAQDDKEKLVADITFLKNETIIENVIINFSIFSKNKITTSEIKLIKINDLDISDFKLLYNEPKSSKLNEIRISAKYPESEFIKNSTDLNFTIVTNSNSKKYIPNKKSTKILKSINLLFN